MSQTNGMTADALRYLDAHLADFTRELCDLSRIPSVSANGFPKEEVRRSAEATVEALRRARVDNVRVLEIPGVHPYVYGEWLKRPGAPTILLYGHHAVQILCRLIAGLTKDDGSLDVPGLYKKIARPSAKELARVRALPFKEAKYKKEAGMLPGVRLGGEKRFSVYEQLWARPALTVIALEARPFLGSSNQIIEAARARLSLRIAPGMDERVAGKLLARKLTTRPPHGARVTARVTGGTPSWTTD